MILVLAHHLAIAFGGVGSWFYKIPDPSHLTVTLLTIFIAINQSFFMGLFFFISGYFSSLSLDKKGGLFFMKGKLIRLGIPWLIYYFILSPTFVLWPGYLSSTPTHLSFSQGPVWFVMALLIFDFSYLIYRQITMSKCSYQLKLPPCPKLFFLCVVMGFITYFVRLYFPLGTNWLGFQLGYCPMYILLFLGGVIAERNNWLHDINLNYARPWMYMMLVNILFIIGFLIYLLNNDLLSDALGGQNSLALMLAIWECFSCVSIIVTVLAVFHTYANRSHRITQHLASSSYTVYIFQGFFIIPVTYYASVFNITGLTGWLLACSISIPLAFFVANYIRKLPYVDRVL